MYFRMFSFRGTPFHVGRLARTCQPPWSHRRDNTRGERETRLSFFITIFVCGAKKGEPPTYNEAAAPCTSKHKSTLSLKCRLQQYGLSSLHRAMYDSNDQRKSGRATENRSPTFTRRIERNHSNHKGSHFFRSSIVGAPGNVRRRLGPGWGPFELLHTSYIFSGGQQQPAHVQQQA